MLTCPKALLAAMALAFPTFAAQGPAQPIPPGSCQRVVTVHGEALTTFTYRPACSSPSLLVVFHGLQQNARGYRDYARKLAAKHCMMVASPLFDAGAFRSGAFRMVGFLAKGTSRGLTGGPATP